LSRGDASLVNGFDDLVELIRLDGNDRDIPGLAPAVAHDLVIPDHFVDRERHILLGLETDDRFDIAGHGAGQFHKARENALRW
jgi:hypothetical protein